MNAANPGTALHRGPRIVSDLVLAMRHLSPDGLSEQWLLRTCGDRHWSMIAEALGQDSAEFTDAEGRSIYAAFCATDFWLAPPGVRLGERAVLSSSLHEVSGTLTGSEHEIHVGGRLVARLLMQSSFVGHDTIASNRRILRRMPNGRMHLPPATAALMALSDQARGKSRQMRNAGPETGTPAMTYVPCPSLDFNAVGLLYFPTFSALAERLDWLRGQAGPLRSRTIVYAGNIDRGDSVMLHVRRPAGTDLVRNDGRIIGNVSVRRYPSCLVNRESVPSASGQ